MSLRHPLASVKGLGASGEGSHHWWLQRVSALALIPLTFWFVFSIIAHLDDGYPAIVAWIAHPPVSVLLMLYVGFTLFHGQLGMQVVFEDYVHNKTTKSVCLLLTKAVFLLAGVASIFAILKIAFS